jgi:hypothetical protein
MQLSDHLASPGWLCVQRASHLQLHPVILEEVPCAPLTEGRRRSPHLSYRLAGCATELTQIVPTIRLGAVARERCLFGRSPAYLALSGHVCASSRATPTHVARRELTGHVAPCSAGSTLASANTRYAAPTPACPCIARARTGLGAAARDPQTAYFPGKSTIDRPSQVGL